MPEFNWLKEAPAKLLVQRIEAYWEARGHKKPKIWLEYIEGTRRIPGIWVIRSDMVGGLPV